MAFKRIPGGWPLQLLAYHKCPYCHKSAVGGRKDRYTIKQTVDYVSSYAWWNVTQALFSVQILPRCLPYMAVRI